jgi:pilus assembly protein Flp/PilA
MQKLVDFFSILKRDEEGAALVEYTVLLGILLIAVIATILVVGGWIGNAWAILCNNISITGNTCTPP